MVYLAVAMAVFFVSLPSAEAQTGAKRAASPPAASDEENKSDKLDVTDLEKKYWAAKDTDFSVVQNRLFPKAGRLALSAGYGMLVNDAYSEGTNLSTSLNYYFSERMGLELNYMQTNAEDNNSTEYFKTRFGATPDHGKIESYYGAAFNWVPFYAKMSVQNIKIIYFDMAISPGVGVTSYEQQVSTGNKTVTAPTVSLDVTQSFFLNRHFAFRFDYKNRWFQEQIVGHSGASAGREIKKETNHTTILLFGATVFF